MQQTNTYKLNLIETTDTFSPQPINENMEKMEEALQTQVQAIEEAKAAGLQVVTGSYTGTGTSGSSKKNTLTFPFNPLVVLISQSDAGSYAGFWLQGVTSGRTFVSADSVVSVTLVWAEKSVSWHHYNNATNQLNESGKTYHYLAFGFN